MATTKRARRTTAAPERTRRPRSQAAAADPAWTVPRILASLRAGGTAAGRASIARFGIVAADVAGLSMAQIQALAKRIGRRHDLVDELWASGCYEARLLVAYLGDPDLLTAAQMERWCRTFDNWGVVDTVCFVLFDRSPLAFAKIAAWAKRDAEFEKRAAFALLASLALHDKTGGDDLYRPHLATIAAAATDPRNFVKKGVLWALRAIGGRSRALHRDALALARQLAAASDPTSRWIGKAAAKELQSAATKKRLASKS
jgi:3-methyladenine DNA glycosylase AlkD